MLTTGSARYYYVRTVGRADLYISLTRLGSCPAVYLLCTCSTWTMPVPLAIGTTNISFLPVLRCLNARLIGSRSSWTGWLEDWLNALVIRSLTVSSSMEIRSGRVMAGGEKWGRWNDVRS